MSFSLTLGMSFKTGLFCMLNLTFNGFPIKLFTDHGIQITAQEKLPPLMASGSDPSQGGTPHLTPGCTLFLQHPSSFFLWCLCDHL